MELIKNKTFGGERPLFGAHDARLEDITITDGESGIKCCKNIECHNSKFYGKYPWWHVDGSLITDCYFAPESRSAIWYSNNMVMKDCTIDGPKFFREMKNLELENVNITDADETFWKVDGLKIKNGWDQSAASVKLKTLNDNPYYRATKVGRGVVTIGFCPFYNSVSPLLRVIDCQYLLLNLLLPTHGVSLMVDF